MPESSTSPRFGEVSEFEAVLELPNHSHRVCHGNGRVEITNLVGLSRNLGGNSDDKASPSPFRHDPNVVTERPNHWHNMYCSQAMLFYCADYNFRLHAQLQRSA